MTLMMMVTNFSETKKQGKSKCFRICVWGGAGRREIRVFLARIFTITTYINNFPFHSHLYSLIVGSKSAEFLFCHGIPEWFFFCQFAFNNLSYLTWLIAFESRKYWPFLFGTNMLSTFSTRSNVTPCT